MSGRSDAWFMSELEGVRRRLGLLAARGVIAHTDDAKKFPLVQVGLLSNEAREVERIGTYGLASLPHDGAEAVVLFMAGDRGHGIEIARDDRRYRPTDALEPGEVMLYDDLGSRVHLKRGGHLEVTAPSSGSVKLVCGASFIEVTDGKVTIQSADVEIKKA